MVGCRKDQFPRADANAAKRPPRVIVNISEAARRGEPIVKRTPRRRLLAGALPPGAPGIFRLRPLASEPMSVRVIPGRAAVARRDAFGREPA